MQATEALRSEASALAGALDAEVAGRTEDLGTAIDRNQRTARAISDELRSRLIAFRLTLFRMGIYDPVLARLDSSTVQQASSSELAAQLRMQAEKL